MTKDNIISAALRLFLTRGYKSVSLIDVAKELGITKGGIYHYFSSKDELLHTALHFFLDRFEGKCKEILTNKASLSDTLHSLLVENTLDVYSKELIGVDTTYNIDYLHHAIEIMRLFPDIQERAQQNQVFLCTALADKTQEAMKKGEIRSGLDSLAFAATIVSMLNGQKSLGITFHTGEMRKRMLDSIWTLVAS